MADADPATDKRLVEGAHGEPGRKRPESRGRRGHLCEAPGGERVVGQGVSPIVEVTHDQRRMRIGRPKEHVAQQPRHLPPPLPLGEAQVRIDQVQRPLG